MYDVAVKLLQRKVGKGARVTVPTQVAEKAAVVHVQMQVCEQMSPQVVGTAARHRCSIFMMDAGGDKANGETGGSTCPERGDGRRREEEAAEQHERCKA